MSLESWAASELSRFGYQNTNEIVSYLMESEKESNIEEYLNAIMDKEEAEHAQFMKEFLQKYSELHSSLGPGFYRKPDFEGNKTDNSKPKNKEKEKSPTAVSQSKVQQNISAPNIPKKKSKFVSLYSEEGQNKDVVLLPGRHKCECQASKHKLVNNCLKCGRIVCEQEGSGPCAFCQNLVISNKEQELISRGTKKSEALHNKLIHNKKIVDNDSTVLSKGLQKAIDHKDKLLEYDRTSEKRTKVFDDENDYFQSNSRWINPADREKLQKYEADLKQKQHDRSNTTFTIDLLGRKVVSEEKSIYNVDDPFVNEILGEGKPDIYSYGENEACQILNLSRPVYVDSGSERAARKCDIPQSGLQRIQDKELQEMRDEGMCLSMHQPWASLLIAGIKLHEGRTWYHSHRGRLWIASTAKAPIPQEISQLEQRYRILLDDENIKFPHHYPVGCLLGCVDVLDVLPQEEYRRQFPEGESESPYVFICEHAQEMILKFPIKGKHKIYELEPKIHQTAMKSLKIN